MLGLIKEVCFSLLLLLFLYRKVLQRELTNNFRKLSMQNRTHMKSVCMSCDLKWVTKTTKITDRRDIYPILFHPLNYSRHEDLTLSLSHSHSLTVRILIVQIKLILRSISIANIFGKLSIVVNTVDWIVI